MGLIFSLIVFVALAAIVVWIADWASGARRYTALAVLKYAPPVLVADLVDNAHP